MMKDSVVLVTGGAGFIGSNLCEALLQQNNRVRCLDNFSTGFRKNIEPFLANKNFTLIEGDVRNRADCEKAVQGVDYVLHQAALGSVPRSIQDPATTNDVNVGGFVNMLFAAKEAGVQRFVYASSSSVYGDSAELPKVEERTGKPLSPYAISKQTDEMYAKNFSTLYGIETVGLRYFNVFGRRQDPNGAYAAVIPKWVSQLLNHEQPVINGDGTFSRDFTYVDNVVQANILAATVKMETIHQRAEKLELTHYQGNSLVFNVAFGGNTTLNGLIDALKEGLARYDGQVAQITPHYGPERAGDIPHSHANVDKAKNLLGYAPQYDAAKGFAMACEWYYQNLK